MRSMVSWAGAEGHLLLVLKHTASVVTFPIFLPPHFGGEGFEIVSKSCSTPLWTIMGSSVQASKHLLWASLGHVIRGDSRAQRSQVYARPL